MIAKKICEHDDGDGSAVEGALAYALPVVVELEEQGVLGHSEAEALEVGEFKDLPPVAFPLPQLPINGRTPAKDARQALAKVTFVYRAIAVNIQTLNLYKYRKNHIYYSSSSISQKTHLFDSASVILLVQKNLASSCTVFLFSAM